ncbi:FMN-dependent dehydrogenase-domain-containing protein [Aspergillus flavus]|uniref:FMN-dependent dehydrogenase-domain-containing protein n=1 Tax=Aspergillus flavus (strain ATCC 200026 / FGSC A1120 / IAM 13836 / NRRL 3357 / JCM 12722 / SRRC 167) TaxID=332952 RepID=A0A7U2MGT8_ASPFN|nr:FMN-dependent dehydrogenase-domain-containing protein [Aspergillus flavus]
MNKIFTSAEVAHHNKENSCWVVLYGKVYDVTHFLSSHPGGAQAILRVSGRDATDDFDPIHPPETMDSIQSALIGSLSLDEKSSCATQTTDTSDEIDVSTLLNLDEIEKAATNVISKKAWAYYYSAADDKITKDFNTQVYRSLLLRPRVFVDCRKCDVETELLGWKVGLPIYVSPTAMARLGHPRGEAGIAEACGAFGALQIIASNSSLSPEQVVAKALPTQVFGWQLYVQLDRRASEAMLARVNRLDEIKFVILTLDAPVSGKREDDERINVKSNPAGSVSAQLFAGTDPSLTWNETLEWLSRHTKKPIILKGLQTHEDVAIAARYTPLVQAVILSNHGGRSLDTAPPAVHTLLEAQKYCPHVFKKMEVWVDGGIRRDSSACLDSSQPHFDPNEQKKFAKPRIVIPPRKMGKKRILVGYGVDIDAVAGWLGSYGGEDSVSDISRGLWAGHIGTPRLLKLFEKYNIKASWFIPGHTLETFPEECAQVRDAGHEIGLHGYSHENPASMTLEQQRDILDKTYKMLRDFCGKPPRGIVAPWWEASAEMVELLLAYGIEYDHSMSHEDCQMYWLRTGDSWTKIDYSQKAETWMKPLVRGQTTGLVEIPGSWYIDDLPPMMFIKNSANSHGWVNPRDVEAIWKDHFDYFYREYDEFVFPMTIHPDVSGRPHVLLMHERIIEHINKHEGVEWVTFEQMCDEFKKKNQPPPGAPMPAAADSVL